MAPPQKNETAQDAMKSVLADLAQASILPDADVQFLTQIQQMIIEHLRSQTSQQHMGGQPAPGGQPPMGMPPGGGAPGGAPDMGGLLGGIGGPGGASPGMSPMGSQGGQPTTDELMRVLSQAGPGGGSPGG